MKKLFMSLSTVMLLAACGAESPESIGQEWCELNGKVYTANSPEEKSAAEDAREAFEEEMEKKYKDDKEMMDKIEEAAEACEDASEGR
jgi:hypothetical protein